MTGKELKERRKAADIKAEKLADILCISPFTLSNWERDKIQIPRIAEIAIDAVLKDIEQEQERQERIKERQKHISELAKGKKAESPE